jgi:Transposase DDE domain
MTAIPFCRAKGRSFLVSPVTPRLVALIRLPWLPWCASLPTRQGQPTGLPLMDRLPVRVCPSRRMPSPQVWAGLAPRGHGSRGWVYGFQLPLVSHDQGERCAFCLTPGPVDDRRPVKKPVRRLWGKRLGDRGCLSPELFAQRWAEGRQRITPIRRNRKNKWMPLFDKLRGRRRALIECVNEQCKNSSPSEHTRPRSPSNGMVNRRCAVVASPFQPKKPALALFPTGHSQVQQSLLMAVTVSCLYRTHVILKL